VNRAPILPNANNTSSTIAAIVIMIVLVSLLVGFVAYLVRAHRALNQRYRMSAPEGQRPPLGWWWDGSKWTPPGETQP
jgi:hypothetical protein